MAILLRRTSQCIGACPGFALAGLKDHGIALKKGFSLPLADARDSVTFGINAAVQCAGFFVASAESSTGTPISTAIGFTNRVSRRRLAFGRSIWPEYIPHL